MCSITFLQKFNNKSFFYDLQQKFTEIQHFETDMDDCMDIKLYEM